MNFTHSIMFHHFHDRKHLPTQGSLSANDFNDMLDWLSEKHNLIGANEYLQKFNDNCLGSNDICLSFDDALLCQYDVALPSLNDRKLDVFFFIYSSIFSGKPDNLEIFRYFRTNYFESIDSFYESFFYFVESKYSRELDKHKSNYKHLNYLNAFPFYTENDKWFRYIRDQMLKNERYEKLMCDLMKSNNFKPEIVYQDLWMSEDCIKEIASQGHLIGLHSYSHPMQMSKLSYDEQNREYQYNSSHLESLVGDVVSMSHPCGDYNKDTLRILSDLNIQIGFRSSLSTTVIKSKFEVPREDHANVYKAMKQ